MMKKIFPCLLFALLLTLLFMSLPVKAETDSAPVVNGLFYGDDDDQKYLLQGYSPPLSGSTRNRAALYKTIVDGYIYFVVVVDRSVNDNVFGGIDIDTAYIQSAGWTEKGGGQGRKLHSFFDLKDSDNMSFQVTCGSEVFTWTHDYLYYDEVNGGWLSGPYGPDGVSGNEPPNLESASSLQWNMNNSSWDWTLGGTRNAESTYKSPATDGATDTDVTDEEGYPPFSTQPEDNITHNYELGGWEWPMVYEIRFPTSDCGPEPFPFTSFIVNTHNSPSKDGTDEVPLAVNLASFTAKALRRNVLLQWETTNETNNLGFNIWRATSPEGERTKVNAEMIPSQVPFAGGGAVYEFKDTTIERGTVYYYWLEAISTEFEESWSDPIEPKGWWSLRDRLIDQRRPKLDVNLPRR